MIPIFHFATFSQQLHPENRENPCRGQPPAQSSGVCRHSYQEIGKSQKGARTGRETEQETGGGRPVHGVSGLQQKPGRHS